MRLTLRTLLAYLDDRLDPANARELGQKISASPFARSLAERIKGVVRKRRLANTDTTQKLIDANLIAEYLDDQLTPELVALIEKEILASDQSLAEVAATHQILGLLADPLEIDDALRERLIQMDPASDDRAEGALTEAEISAKKEWQPLAPAAAASRRSPMLVLGMMVLGWLVLLFVDTNLYRQPHENSDADSQPPVVADDPVPAGAGVKPGPQEGLVENGKNAPPPMSAKSGAVKTADGKGMNTTGIGKTPHSKNLAKEDAPVPKMTESHQAIARAQALARDPGQNTVIAPVDPPSGPPENQNPQQLDATQPVMAEDSTEQPAEPTATTPASSAPASSAPASNEPTVSEAVATDVAKADMDEKLEPVAAPEFSYVVHDESDIMIVSSVQPPAAPKEGPDDAEADELDWLWASKFERRKDWFRALSDRYACVTAPFSVTIRCPVAGWKIQTSGSTLFQSASNQEAGIRLLNGRLILQRTVTDQPLPFLLDVGGKQLLISLKDTQQHLAISVMMARTDSDSEGRGAGLQEDLPVLVKLGSIGGSCEIRQKGSAGSVTMEPNRELNWRSEGEFPSQSIRLSVADWDWVESTLKEPTAGQAELHRSLAAKLKSHDSVHESVIAVASDSNPMIAEWSSQIPIVQRDGSMLVGLLFTAEQQLVRTAAILALQDYVKSIPNGTEKVKSLLGTRLNAAELEQAMRLLSDISRVSLEDRLTSEWMVDMLQSDRLEIREMAISTLDKYLNTRQNYFADDTKSRRDRAARRWKSILDRNNGRLLAPQE